MVQGMAGLAMLLQEDAGIPGIGWWLFIAALLLVGMLWMSGRRRP